MSISREELVIDIGLQFSPYPSGRFPSDGQFSGEFFREKYLRPALQKALEKKEKLVVDIDGVRSFGSSFLEEAFAGLIRLGEFDRDDVLRHLSIRCNKPHIAFFKDEILDLVEHAEPAPAFGG